MRDSNDAAYYSGTYATKPFQVLGSVVQEQRDGVERFIKEHGESKAPRSGAGCVALRGAFRAGLAAMAADFSTPPGKKRRTGASSGQFCTVCEKEPPAAGGKSLAFR